MSSRTLHMLRGSRRCTTNANRCVALSVKFKAQCSSVSLTSVRCRCCAIHVVGMIMDISIRCTPGESWPYYLASSGYTVGARCSGSTGVYPHRVPTFRRGTWLRRMIPDTELRVRFPMTSLPCNLSIVGRKPRLQRHVWPAVHTEAFIRC
jgi:hypothetical protein